MKDPESIRRVDAATTLWILRIVQNDPLFQSRYLQSTIESILRQIKKIPVDHLSEDDPLE